MQESEHKQLLNALTNISILSTPGRSVRGDYHNRYIGKTADDLAIDFMDENNIPGLTVAIVQAPYITRVIGYGVGNLQTKQLISQHSTFNVGEMTGGYTAIAIMQLVEEGKLNIEESISKYLKNVPPSEEDITIKDLLLHTSGIPDYTDFQGFDSSKDYNPEEVAEMIAKQSLEFAPGTQVKCSKSNSYLLGLIIEKASGMKYQEYVTENQIKRLNLQHTFFVSNLSDAPSEGKPGQPIVDHKEFLHDPRLMDPTEVPTGYLQKGEEIVEAPKLTWGATFASTGMYSSAADISSWDISLAGNILLKDKKSRDFLYSPIQLKDGTVVPSSAGWYFPGREGLMLIHGAHGGHSALLTRFTAESDLLCVTLLANKEDVPGLDVLARNIAATYDINLAPPRGSQWSVTLQSPFSVKKTLDRLTEAFEGEGGTIFARFDQCAKAKEAGLQLNPTELIIIGKPAVGTKLMQVDPAISLELPMRIASWEDDVGQVWISFTDPRVLSREYRADIDEKLLNRIYNALLKNCEKAVGNIAYL